MAGGGKRAEKKNPPALFCSRLRRAKGLVDGRDGDKSGRSPEGRTHIGGEARLRRASTGMGSGPGGEETRNPAYGGQHKIRDCRVFLFLLLRRATCGGSGTAGENKTRNPRLRWYKKSETWGTPHHTTPLHSNPLHPTPHRSPPSPTRSWLGRQPMASWAASQPMAGWVTSQWLAARPTYG